MRHPKPSSRPRRLWGIAFAAILAILAPALGAASALAERPTIAVGELRVNGVADPVGIDDRRPELGWQLDSTRRDQLQRAYQVRVASEARILKSGGANVWDSGKVRSRDSINVRYDGRTLRSREHLWWSVRVWDERGDRSEWSDPGEWEVGLLKPGDWEASWISHPEWLELGRVEPLTIEFPARTARYVRLDVTRLGLPAPGEGFPEPASRLQLAEFQAFGAGQLVSDSATVSASESLEVADTWSTAAVTDGKLTSEGRPHGYTSFHRFERDLDEPIWLELDLGRAAEVDEVRLYPRTEVLTEDGAIPNFPEDFTVRTRPDPAAEWEDAHAVEGQEPPPPPPGEPEALPLLARGFEVDRGLERARLYATGLGVYEARLNGRKVGDAVLEPANTDYRKRVHYSTYDVTEALRTGSNKLGFALGNGIYNVPSTPGRYQKFSGSMGPPKLIAQLELTYADGSRRTIATDDSWGAALGPVTFSGWYGGEDHDARRELGGWDKPGFDVRGFAPKAAGKDADGVRKGFAPGDWTSAAVTDPPSSDAVLSAQEAPPVRVQETLSAVSREEVAPGVWLYDLGRNIAGWPRITLSGAAGETVRMRPGERLTDGRVDQRQVGQPVTFDYTAASDQEESWHPRFMYYGFRWIEVSGVEEPPAPEDVGALVLRADNQRAGSLRTSDETLNRVHELVVRAIEGNMLSVLTDCPHREKLGWLEETHLMFDGVAANFDVAAYYRQQVQNMADAQLENGMVPDIAPEYTVFSGGFRDDPNWGGAIVLAPLRMYERYGDARVLREHYEAMDRYMGYLATKATDGLLTYGLGDWGAFDTSTPIGIPATSVYYRMAEAMTRIAEVTGHEADVARYRELAEAIRARFNAAFLDPATGSYGSGSQASNALPLAAGMVPEASRDAVLDSLLADVESREWHLSTGEIGLRALLDSLGDAGEIETVLELATNPTPPSYAHMVSSGATSLPEFWDLAGSLNHFMMGAIDDWMYRYLAGIQPAAPGFSEIRIAPRLTDRLDHVRAVWPSPYGRIVSGWKRRGERVELEVEIPVNTTATVELPDGTTREVGSGHWQFEVRE